MAWVESRIAYRRGVPPIRPFVRVAGSGRRASEESSGFATAVGCVVAALLMDLLAVGL